MSSELEMAESVAENLKSIMRQIPYPVTVITAGTKKDKRGITIGSFTSLSLEPPLISFNVSKSSQMHELIANTDHFVVHIPESSQEKYCNRFAVPNISSEEQFKGLDYAYNEHGIPVLKDLVAIISCKKYKFVEAGDHAIVIGEVTDIVHHKEDAAILYLDGAYHAIRG